MYLNWKHDIQGDLYGPSGHSLWEVVYHCLRAGDVDAVQNVTESHLKNIPTVAALAVVLDGLNENEK